MQIDAIFQDTGCELPEFIAWEQSAKSPKHNEHKVSISLNLFMTEKFNFYLILFK